MNSLPIVLRVYNNLYLFIIKYKKSCIGRRIKLLSTSFSISRDIFTKGSNKSHKLYHSKIFSRFALNQNIKCTSIIIFIIIYLFLYKRTSNSSYMIAMYKNFMVPLFYF